MARFGSPLHQFLVECAKPCRGHILVRGGGGGGGGF